MFMLKDTTILYFLQYVLTVSVISVLVCIYDKYAAKKGKRRIREDSLLTLSILGGSVALLITMKIIRHKTKHKKFMLGIPIIIIFQIAVVIFVLIYPYSWL